VNIANARNLLEHFDFTRLFVEELGWSSPSFARAVPMTVKGIAFNRREIAQLSGVVVIEVVTDDGEIPDAVDRSAIHKEIAKLHHENVLIFVDAQRSQSLWYWVKRQDRKLIPRTHIYVLGQSGDLLLSKLGAMAVDFADFDESGHVPLLEVTARLKHALDIERVTKKFYGEFQEHHFVFIKLIKGIDDERDRRWYASVLLNRLMFIYFLQKKFFLDGGDESYLQNKLAHCKKCGEGQYYSTFLKALFFEGFAKPEDKRTAEVNALLGKVKYLNGGLFLKHPIEQRWPNIAIPDEAFENLLALFSRYSWNLNDIPGGQDNEINPDVLGYIFEKYINQKAFGAYYTRPEITEYLCERTIHRLILDGVAKGEGKSARTFDSVGDLLLALDAPLCKKLLHEVLPNLRLLDPACGSAAFLVAAMKTLINIYAAVIGKIDFLSDRSLQDWLRKSQKEHKSVSYFIKRSIITNNLFGVDIMEEAVEIAKLRLFLALVASADTPDDLEPLPNIEFNIMTGNSLIGLMHVDDAEFEKRHPAELFRKSYREVLEEKNELIEVYRRATTYSQDLQELRDNIQARKQAAILALNDILLREFAHLGIKYEEATWDEEKKQEGKPKKRALKESDIAALKPFHWGYEFDQILGVKGGFDAIITNPPWEIFKPNAKEFFEEYSDLVTKKKMTIKEFEKAQAEILKDPDIRAAWLKYLSEYPHVSSFYRSAPQYKNQISIVDGKKAGSDTNLYKLFTEQCFNLLRPGGYCGIVIPSGIYTDLGTKQLRAMLFAQSRITGLFCFENRKFVFEGVDCRFKFVVLSYVKGGKTERFPAAFMRHDVTELERFPQEGAIEISVPLIRRLSPDSLSVMEFKTPLDVRIAEKMLKFPLLGERIEGSWNVSFTAEFHMTNDSHLFKTEPGKGRLPLYEGKMIWHFDHRLAAPRYWLVEREGRAALLGRRGDDGQKLDYQAYRLGFRDIASNTNERTLVSSMIPPTFHGNKIPTVRVYDDDGTRLIDNATQLFLCSAWNSFVLDYAIRMRVTTTLNFFYLYQLPVPRLTDKDAAFRPIVERAARLICTTPEFDELAKEIFGGLATAKSVGVTDSVERAKLRAELDGLVAHLYGLTEEEFAYILTTFPLVPDADKNAALNALCNVAKGLIK
jgi:type I restriction-modification system DNA methylase subunit